MNIQQNNTFSTNDVLTTLKQLGITIPSDVTDSLKDKQNISYGTLNLIIHTVAEYNIVNYEVLYNSFVNEFKKHVTNGTLLSTTDIINDPNNVVIKTSDEPLENNLSNNYEHVNHPSHYNNYNIEVIDMMEKIWGTKNLINFCLMNAFKYRMRMGTKPDNSIQQDLQKEQWYLNKAKQLKEKDNNPN